MNTTKTILRTWALKKASFFYLFSFLRTYAYIYIYIYIIIFKKLVGVM